MKLYFEYKLIMVIFCFSFVGLLLGINENLFSLNYLSYLTLLYLFLCIFSTLYLLNDYYKNNILIIRVIRKSEKKEKIFL